MALNLESEKPPSYTPHANLRRESTLKRLIREGRAPFLVVTDGQEQLERPVCFIPPSKSKPAETFEVSLDEAIKIALIRNKLQKLM